MRCRGRDRRSQATLLGAPFFELVVLPSLLDLEMSDGRLYLSPGGNGGHPKASLSVRVLVTPPLVAFAVTSAVPLTSSTVAI